VVTDGQPEVVDFDGKTISLDEYGVYNLDDGTSWWIYNPETETMEGYSFNGGNLKVWDAEKGRYTQVMVEKGFDKEQQESVKADKLVSSKYGLVAEY
jgi:hypothetical protein